MEQPKKIKIAAVVVGLLGICVLVVAIWAMEAPYKVGGVSGSSPDGLGAPPKLAVSAGVLAIVLAFCTFFAHLDNKIHLYVIGIGLVVITALSIAAVGKSVSDLNNAKQAKSIAPEPLKTLLNMIIRRLEAIAAVDGIAAVVQIVKLVIVGLAAKQAG